MGMIKQKGKTQKIRLDWKNMGTEEIFPGTPMGDDGQIHNDEKAKGITMDTLTTPWHGVADILIVGEVDEKEAERSSGIKLSAKAKKALSDITFTGVNRGAAKKTDKGSK